MFQEKVRYIKRIGDMTGYSYIEGEYRDFSLQASVDEDYDLKDNGVRRYFKITAISKSGAKTTLNTSLCKGVFEKMRWSWDNDGDYKDDRFVSILSLLYDSPDKHLFIEALSSAPIESKS